MDALDKALAKINPPEINYLKDLDRRTCYIGERILRNGLVKRPFEVPRPTKFNVAEFHNTSLSDADVNGVLQVTNQYDLNEIKLDIIIQVILILNIISTSFIHLK